MEHYKEICGLEENLLNTIGGTIVFIFCREGELVLKYICIFEAQNVKLKVVFLSFTEKSK